MNVWLWISLISLKFLFLRLLERCRLRGMENLSGLGWRKRKLKTSNRMSFDKLHIRVINLSHSDILIPPNRNLEAISPMKKSFPFLYKLQKRRPTSNISLCISFSPIHFLYFSFILFISPVCKTTFHSYFNLYILHFPQFIVLYPTLFYLLHIFQYHSSITDSHSFWGIPVLPAPSPVMLLSLLSLSRYD